MRNIVIAFLLAASLAKADEPFSGWSDATTVDLRSSPLVASKTETLTYSTNWVDNAGENATAIVAVDGTPISQVAGEGEVCWTPTHNGTYELTHKVMVGEDQVGETLTATFEVSHFPATPIIRPVSGTIFDSSQTISMSCESSGATIHYTTDGSFPTMDSPVYKKFRIYGKTTINAIAFYADGTPSMMATSEYAMGACETPAISPSGGTVFVHPSELEVSIAWAGENGVVRYTTDGSEPTSASPAYSQPFTISETTTVRAKAFSDTFFDSSIVSATMTCVWVKVAMPVITAAETFTGAKNKVAISCETAGATIHYTTDGSEPTSTSPVYEKPIYVTDSCVVRAFAVKVDCMDSDVASCNITRVWSIGDTMGKCDHEFSTGGDLGFVRTNDATAVLGESMRSGAILNCQTSILSTVVVGSGTLTFKWKTSCEEDPPLHEWDHAEFVVDGDVVLALDGETDWQGVSHEIEGDGNHEIVWRYVKDGDEGVGEDCLWVSEYSWTSDYVTTQTTEVPVPYDWLSAKCSGVVDEYGSYESAAKGKAHNNRLTVEQCYISGVDPESKTNDFSVVIEMCDGAPVLKWSPDLKEDRAYKVWGRGTLDAEDSWAWPTNSLHRFFRVTVDMP